MQTAVTNPKHYKSGSLEAWDVLDEFFPDDPLLWNAGKYLMRLGKKDAPAQEIGKIKAYLDRWLEKRGKELLEANQNTWTDPATGREYTYWYEVPCEANESLHLLARDGAIADVHLARRRPYGAPFLVGVSVWTFSDGGLISDTFRAFQDRWAEHVEDNNL